MKCHSKISFVTPVPKKVPTPSPRSFRPVSITSILARVFEKILKSVIVNHLETCAVIPPQQHGFRTGRSTVTQMLETLNDWTAELSNNHPVDVIYFDFEKAFDKVNHQLLVSKLHQVGIHHRIIDWIAAYLSDRSFRVVIGSSFSMPRRVLSGIPQGSVLAPILFNIYTFDLPFLCTPAPVRCKMFADDIKKYRTV